MSEGLFYFSNTERENEQFFIRSIFAAIRCLEGMLSLFFMMVL